MPNYKIKFTEIVERTYIAEVDGDDAEDALDQIKYGDRFGYCYESKPIDRKVRIDIDSTEEIK
jgi:hypothetical protein